MLEISPISISSISIINYYADIMLYAFQPLLCLKLCRHNRLKPNSENKVQI